MLTINLPRLLGSPDDACELVDLEFAGESSAGEDVCISFRDSMSLSDAAAHAMTAKLLGVGKARRILIRAATERQADQIIESARAHGLAALVSNLDEHGWITMTQDMSVRCICNGGPCMCGSRVRDDYLEMIRTGGT